MSYPYTLAEAKLAAKQPMDQYHRELMQWLIERVELADAFVRAHCELEALSLAIGPDAACATPLNDHVINLHFKLEAAVLGDERAPVRRSS